MLFFSLLTRSSALSGLKIDATRLELNLIQPSTTVEVTITQISFPHCLTFMEAAVIYCDVQIFTPKSDFSFLPLIPYVHIRVKREVQTRWHNWISVKMLTTFTLFFFSFSHSLALVCVCFFLKWQHIGTNSLAWINQRVREAREFSAPFMSQRMTFISFYACYK